MSAAISFVFVGVSAFEQAHAGDGGEHPSQFGHFGYVGLAEESGALWIEAQSEIVQRHIADIVA
jgi:hypothetical protein